MRKLIVTDSSNVKSIVWEGDSLVVEFSSGGRYQYAGCSLADFGEACSAASVGAWVQARLVKRADIHPATKLERELEAPRSADEATLRAIASIAPSGTDLLLTTVIHTARDAVAGRLTPLPLDFPRPYAVDHTVQWRESGRGEMHLAALASMTPDQASGVAAAIAAAAMEARS